LQLKIENLQPYHHLSTMSAPSPQELLKATVPLTEVGKAPLDKLYSSNAYTTFNTLTRVPGKTPVAITIWKGDAKAIAFVPDADVFFRVFPRTRGWAAKLEAVDIWHVHVARSTAHCRQAVAAALLIASGHPPRVWNELGKHWLLWLLRCWGASPELMCTIEQEKCLISGLDVSLEEHDVKLAPGLDKEWLAQLALEKAAMLGMDGLVLEDLKKALFNLGA
jgi:hypothetical protein